MFDLYPIYTNLFFTMSPEHMKAILATDFPKFAKGAPKACLSEKPSIIFYVGERQQEVLGFVLGTGVLNSDGTSTRPLFSFIRQLAILVR